MDESTSQQRAGLWDRPTLVFLAIAYGFSWTFWIGSWVVAAATDAGQQLVNEDLVRSLTFGDRPPSTLLWLSLLSLVGVYGPMLAGVVATRLDPDASSRDLWARVRRVRVGTRPYALVLGILAVIVVPVVLLTALTADRAADAPGAGTLVGFLAVFLLFQLLTSGTEEIGWRGYLNEKLRDGRDFWDTGWAVGVPWAVWHVPVVVMMFVHQGMPAVAIVSSLVGFGIGIVAAAILHAWFYERTRSVFVNIVIHAVFNTAPLTAALLFEESPVAVVANLALWAVVLLLRRRHVAELADETAPASSFDHAGT